jgi:hypothetical protein
VILLPLVIYRSNDSNPICKKVFGNFPKKIILFTFPRTGVPPHLGRRLDVARGLVPSPGRVLVEGTKFGQCAGSRRRRGPRRRAGARVVLGAMMQPRGWLRPALLPHLQTAQGGIGQVWCLSLGAVRLQHPRLSLGRPHSRAATPLGIVDGVFPSQVMCGVTSRAGSFLL